MKAQKTEKVKIVKKDNTLGRSLLLAKHNKIIRIQLYTPQNRK
jgi:hypothetical protein